MKHGDLIPDEMTYLLTEYAGDPDVEAYSDRVFKLWTKMAQLNILEKRNVDAYKNALPRPRPFPMITGPGPVRPGGVVHDLGGREDWNVGDDHYERA